MALFHQIHHREYVRNAVPHEKYTACLTLWYAGLNAGLHVGHNNYYGRIMYACCMNCMLDYAALHEVQHPELLHRMLDWMLISMLYYLYEPMHDFMDIRTGKSEARKLSLDLWWGGNINEDIAYGSAAKVCWDSLYYSYRTLNANIW